MQMLLNPHVHGKANAGADFGLWFPSPRLKTAKSIFYRESLDLESVSMCFNWPSCRLAGILQDL